MPNEDSPNGNGNPADENGTDAPVLVTFFINEKAQTKSEGTHTLAELAVVIGQDTVRASKAKLPLWKLAKFGDQRTERNCLRHDANVIQVSGAIVEHDAGTMPFDEAVQRVRDARLQALLYTSPSHKVDKPRWRVAFPFNGQLPPLGHKTMVDRANALFDGALAGESWTLSQSYYYGRVEGNPDFQIKVVEGDRIDGRPDLAERPKSAQVGLAALPPKLQKLIKTGDAAQWDGNRSDMVYHVCCSLVRHGWTEDQIIDIQLDRTKGLSEHIYDQNNFQQYAKRQAERARAAVEKDENSVLKLNNQFALVRFMNKVAILNEYTDDRDRPTFSLWGPEHMRLWLMDQAITVDGKSVPIMDLWLAHPKRRRYEGITFKPSGTPAGWYNLWRGFAMAPSTAGSCEKFKAHLLDNVCNGDRPLYLQVFGWFAAIFQQPATKCGTALVLRGKMGVGKTIVGVIVGKLLGHHYVQTAQARFITGRFNSHLASCILLHSDEATWAGDKQAESALKDLITGHEHLIELKGYEAYPVPNLIRLLFTGNPDRVVPAGMEERRMFVLDVGDAQMQNIPYFTAIIDELEHGGYARLLHAFLTFDLSQVDLRAVPKTEALLEQKLGSLPPDDAWWLDILQRGSLPGDSKAVGRSEMSHLSASYLEHVRARSRWAKTEVGLGLYLKKIVPGLTLYRRGPRDNRRIFYHFPSLTECRRGFEERLRQPVQWSDGESDWRKNFYEAPSHSQFMTPSIIDDAEPDDEPEPGPVEPSGGDETTLH